MRKGLTAAGVLVTALALAAAGCGGAGGGEALSKEEYVSQLDAICSDYNVTQNEIGSPVSLEELQSKGGQLADEFEKALAKVKELDPPSEIESATEAFVTNAEEQLAVRRDLIDAAKESDQAALQQLIAKGDELAAEGDRLAKKLGVGECEQ